ncbi:MAG: YqiA/YcfP family alpha/beta fold hydrolase, partial [Rubrivivax sp.]
HQGIAAWPAASSVVLGSSLGGFYATAVAEATGWPAVVMNPAVDPARDLAAHIGEQTAFHTPEERFFFRAEYVDELRAIAVPALTRPERILAVIAKGDELLDWHEMQARYAGAQLRLIDGSDHALSDFDEHLPHVLRFLRLVG